MVSIYIGDGIREYANFREIEEAWIIQQITRQRRAGESFGVLVRIHEGPLRITLATPRASVGGSGGRPPSTEESRVFDLWNQCGLNNDEFAPGRLIEFLKRLGQMLR